MQTRRYLTCLLALLFTPGLALQAGDDTQREELDNSSHVEDTLIEQAQQPEAVKPGQAARVANVVLGILDGILGVLAVVFYYKWKQAGAHGKNHEVKRTKSHELLKRSNSLSDINKVDMEDITWGTIDENGKLQVNSDGKHYGFDQLFDDDSMSVASL